MSRQPDLIYCLRTCDQDLRSYEGFQWPEAGPVEALNWDPSTVCGGGLHGFLNGEGNGSLASWDDAATWLVFSADRASVVDLRGKVKVPRAEVLFAGDRERATAFLQTLIGPGHAIIGGTATAGGQGTATAGYRGTAIAGYSGTATAGDYGTATAGDRGTATAGYSGTATAGDSGTIVIAWWDVRHARQRLAVGYVGEGGIEAGVPYEVRDGVLVRAKD